MINVVCDFCGKIIGKKDKNGSPDWIESKGPIHEYGLRLYDYSNKTDFNYKDYTFCENCYTQLKSWINKSRSAIINGDDSIDILELSVRSHNCLHRIGILTIAQLCNLTIEELRAVRNLGRRSVDEVVKKLDERGLSLRVEEENDDDQRGY